ATLDAGGGYSTYSWNTLATTETIPVTTAGTYTVTVTNGSSCSATASTVITVNSSPVAFAGNDTTICNGSNVPLVATGGGSYAWSNGASTASNTVHPNVTTTYTVTVTTGVGCSASNNVLVTVKPFTPPNIAAIGPRGFCAGSSNPAILIASSGYISYLWSNGATTQTDTIHTIGTYWVIATSANGCSDTSAAMVLYNFPAAIPPVIVADDTTDFCEGDSISVIMHTTTPYYDYNWAGGSTTPEIDVTHVGNYDVTVTDSNGCTAVSNIIPVKFIPKPVAYFNDGASGTTLTFYNTSLNGQTYLWEFGDGDTSTAFDPVHQYAVPGTDTIKLIASNICGSDTQIVIIKVGFGPGIQENMFVDNVSVYPVPTNGDIAVTFDYSGLTALDVKIYNLLGQIQYRETVNELTGKYHNIINMSQMSTGIYLLQIISDKGSVNIKLVKG
ncbi:MAG: T9SS type A sorting domain-containing protein, partial [Bacteroidales bacterium]